MSFDLEKTLASKRALRRDLAARPIAEKLRMLDALRERTLALRGSKAMLTESERLEETVPPDRIKPG